MRKKIRLGLTLAVVASALASAGARAEGPSGYEFVDMPDGVRIAVSVTVPDGCDAADPCPAIFEMSGYDGGGASADDRGTLAGEYGLGTLEDDSRQLTRHFDDAHENLGKRYVIVHASVRGTGCSGGEFDLFSMQGALDGKYIIDQWIPAQPWSNGDVGIVGHSYGGITGTLVASTNPVHLRAVSVSGLIDDLYRGIVYPGGVSNYGFPLLWTGGIRTAYDLGGGLAPRLVRPVTDGYAHQSPECAAAASTKSRSVLNDAIVQGVSDTDNEWFRARSLVTHVARITAPTHIVGVYQDQETGARGPTHVWEKLRTPFKRLVLSNGNHHTAGIYPGTAVTKDRVDWLNFWLHGVWPHDGHSEPQINFFKPVRVYLESDADEVPNGIIDSDRFPLRETTWRDYYFDANETLSTSPGSGSASYISGSPRNGWFRQFGTTAGTPFTSAKGPDQLWFSRVLSDSADTTIVGPITASLRLSATALDTEVYVEVIDESPTGTRAYLQRGLLKASHRAIYDTHSDCVDPTYGNRRIACDDADAHMYRPFRPHARADDLTPGAEYDLFVEIWPLGHVFRKGHTLRVMITTPPVFDNYYAYVPKRPAGVNTLHFGAGSKITLPVVDMAAVSKPLPLGAPRACEQQVALRCLKPGQY